MGSGGPPRFLPLFPSVVDCDQDVQAERTFFFLPRRVCSAFKSHSNRLEGWLEVETQIHAPEPTWRFTATCYSFQGSDILF